ncbi:MAG: 5'-methylthioadenosine/S-adenosylhomocysteine nucleosidase [Chloroflexi bacterium]|nr:5'-methylthioadenosine/S-adenosylhomocysteine nucleosidase [Chloroflexota bacterium]
MKTLVITPLQEELDFFLQSCARRGYRAENSMAGRLPVARISDLGITLARGGTGKVQFAVQTQHLLDHCPDCELVICAGAGGALADNLAISDVVVATATVEHDFNNKFNASPHPRFDGDQTVIAGLRRVSPPGAFKVHFGAVASGDEDVVEFGRRKALHQATGALAVAWEGAGGARACAFSGVPFVEIRGVTDAADRNAPSDFEANLEVAMSNVATLITSWISSSLKRTGV